jgi:hypothetical protein
VLTLGYLKALFGKRPLIDHYYYNRKKELTSVFEEKYRELIES